MAKTMTLREELLYKMHVFEGRWEKFAEKNDLEVRFIGNEDFYKLVEKAAVIRARLKFKEYWEDGGYEVYALKQEMYGSWNMLKDLCKIWDLDKPGFEADAHARQLLHDAYNYELSLFNDLLKHEYSEIRKQRLEEAMETRWESNKIALMQVRESHRDVYDGVSERSIVQAYDEYVNCGKDW